MYVRVEAAEEEEECAHTRTQGTGVIKAGFGGEDMPSCLLQNIVGRPKHDLVMSGGVLQGDSFVGEMVDHHRGVLRLSYPMEHGYANCPFCRTFFFANTTPMATGKKTRTHTHTRSHVQDWNDMEAVWNHLFGMLDVPIKEVCTTPQRANSLPSTLPTTPDSIPSCSRRHL